MAKEATCELRCVGGRKCRLEPEHDDYCSCSNDGCFCKKLNARRKDS